MAIYGVATYGVATYGEEVTALSDNFTHRDADGAKRNIRAIDIGGDILVEQVGNPAGSQVDGHSATLGSTADAAWGGSGNASAIALLKLTATKLNGTLPQSNAVGSQLDGHSLTLGATTDADTTNTVIGRLKHLNTILTDVWDATNHKISTSGVSTADTVTFTAGTSLASTAGGVFNDSVADLTTGQSGAIRATAKRALHTTPRTVSGLELFSAAAPGLVAPVNAAGTALFTATNEGQVTIRTSAHGEIFAAATPGSVVNRNAAGTEVGTATAPLQATLRNTSNAEMFTITTPAQVTQAALAVGTDKVAATAVTTVAVTITGNGAAQQIIAAPGVGTHLRIWAATYCQKSTGTYGDVGYRPFGGSDVEKTTMVAQGQPGGRRFSPNYWEIASNTALYSSANPTGQDVIYNVDYEVITP